MSGLFRSDPTYGFGARAYDGSTGKTIWTRSLSNSSTLNSGKYLIGNLNNDSVADLVVVQHMPGQFVYGIDGRNGDILWTYSVPIYLRPNRMQIGKINDDDIDDPLLFTLDGEILILDGTNGTLIRGQNASFNTPLVSTSFDVTGDGQTEYFVGFNNGGIEGYDGASGIKLWNQSESESGIISITRIFLGNSTPYLAFGNLAGVIKIVNPLNGDVLDTIDLMSGLRLIKVCDFNLDLFQDIIALTRQGEVIYIDGFTKIEDWRVALNSSWLWDVAFADFTEDGINEIILPRENQILILSANEQMYEPQDPYSTVTISSSTVTTSFVDVTSTGIEVDQTSVVSSSSMYSITFIPVIIVFVFLMFFRRKMKLEK